MKIFILFFIKEIQVKAISNNIIQRQYFENAKIQNKSGEIVDNGCLQVDKRF